MFEDITLTSDELANITFSPIVVSRGRKFRGQAYNLGIVTSYAVAYNVMCYTARLWNAKERKFVFANDDFLVDDDTVSAEQILQDKIDYVKNLMIDQYNWCKNASVGKSDNEIIMFARNCVKKHYPEFMPFLHKFFPDVRDTITEITKTLEWAMHLKSRPAVIYGHVCKGGKDYPLKKKLNIAKNTLDRQGITSRSDFEDCWKLALFTFGVDLSKA